MRRTTLERMGKHVDDLKNAEDVYGRNGYDRQVVRNISKRMNGGQINLRTAERK